MVQQDIRKSFRCFACGKKQFISVGKVSGTIEVKCKCKMINTFSLTNCNISDKIISIESHELP